MQNGRNRYDLKRFSLRFCVTTRICVYAYELPIGVSITMFFASVCSASWLSLPLTVNKTLVVASVVITTLLRLIKPDAYDRLLQLIEKRIVSFIVRVVGVRLLQSLFHRFDFDDAIVVIAIRW